MLRPLLLVVLSCIVATGEATPATNVILVTVDGLRWQEVFRGADERLLKDQKFTPKDYAAFEPHQKVGANKAREALMPFLWSTIVKTGTVLGDRDHGSTMRVTNPWWFSYPGYNEILTGRADPKVDSNDKRLNENVTVLEWLNRQPNYQGRVQAFGSWDVFPYIINSQRSGVPVNISSASIVGQPTQHETWLQQLQAQMPLAFPAVRHDAFTHQHALEALRSDQPRVVYIAYGEPDDFAHEGKYGEYLGATHRFDAFLKELWETVQGTEAYANRTAILITTDHGRGELPLENWQHHSSLEAARRSDPKAEGIPGSEQIWFAALGANISSQGLKVLAEEQLQSQVTATMLKVLGIEAGSFDAKIAPSLPVVAEDPKVGRNDTPPR
jgi:Type I phosphodiesterase / nucleotide pyrophosphatase